MKEVQKTNFHIFLGRLLISVLISKKLNKYYLQAVLENSLCKGYYKELIDRYILNNYLVSYIDLEGNSGTTDRFDDLDSSDNEQYIFVGGLLCVFRMWRCFGKETL